MRKPAYLLLAGSLVLAGCGSTRILSQCADCDIYMDGRYLGQGSAKVASMGPPRTALLEARKGEQVVGSASMKRSIEVTTVLLGMCSYFTALYWGQYYPDYVYIPVPQATAAKSTGWGSPLQQGSGWDQPISTQR